ncbi:hypothetical protein [Streptomyces kanamyceticus]|uniref:hypothetical protein n=1 Tax=Streptomyces kanamyceticus TaxID=1967 RepID=UPI000A3DED2B|nr:hypothetical protein [Streptomyces kanamyceticus]
MLRSLARAVERTAHQHRARLRKDAETGDLDEPAEPPDPVVLAALIEPPEPADPPDGQLLARVRQWHTDIHQLRERDWTISAIARRLGRDRKTVRHYLTTDLDQIRASARERRPNGHINRFKPYLQHRFRSGATNGYHRHRERPGAGDGFNCTLNISRCPAGHDQIHSFQAGLQAKQQARGREPANGLPHRLEPRWIRRQGNRSELLFQTGNHLVRCLTGAALGPIGHGGFAQDGFHTGQRQAVEEVESAGTREAISEQDDRRVLTGKVSQGHAPPGAALVLAAEYQQFTGRVE